MYLPDFYRKDRLSGDPSGTEELRKFELNNDKSCQSWTDENVSEHPKFYNADIKNELTNIGAFFDKNNQYSGKSSVNSEPLTTDRCYKNKNGDTFCEDYTRLQLVPPSLISDPQKCYALNSWGMSKDKMLLFSDNTDRVMNGGIFFERGKEFIRHPRRIMKHIRHQLVNNLGMFILRNLHLSFIFILYLLHHSYDNLICFSLGRLLKISVLINSIPSSIFFI